MTFLTRTSTYGFLNRRVGEAREARQFPRTGQTTSYRTGDDANIPAGNPLSAALRFQTIRGVIVYDRLTGLYWPADYATSPGSPFDAAVDWEEAIDQCLALDFGGFDDWRLPNILELASIVDFESPPAFSAITVNTAGNPVHWTSTTYGIATTLAYSLNMGSGLVGLKTKTAVEDEWVIPVRGGI